MKYNRMTRRMFLQGSGGALLTIPFLGSLVSSTAHAAPNAVKRFVMFTNHGSPNEITFFGKGYRNNPDPMIVSPGNILAPSVNSRLLSNITGDLSYILGPFSHLKSNLAVIRGLDLYASDGGAHPGSFATAASGFNGSGDYLNSKQVSIDTLIAGIIADPNSLKSRRHMLISSGFPSHSGRDGLLGENPQSFSYRKNTNDPTKGTEKNPSLGSTDTLLANFFGIGIKPAQTIVPRRQLLNDVFADFKTVRNRRELAATDRLKLDAYMGLLNDVENEIDAPAGIVGAGPALERELFPPVLTRQSGETETSFIARQSASTDAWLTTNRDPGAKIRMRNHMRLIAAAFASDLTRVASVQLGGGGSHSTHHASNMHQRSETDSVAMADYSLIQRNNAASVAFLMDCLAEVGDPAGGSLLDHSLIYWNQQYGCVVSSGGGHSKSRFPVVLGGGLAMPINFNQYIDYTFNDSLGVKRGLPLNNLLVTIMNCFGIGSSNYEIQSGKGYGSYDVSTVSQLSSSVVSTAGRRSALPQLYKGPSIT